MINQHQGLLTLEQIDLIKKLDPFEYKEFQMRFQDTYNKKKIQQEQVIQQETFWNAILQSKTPNYSIQSNYLIQQSNQYQDQITPYEQIQRKLQYAIHMENDLEKQIGQTKDDILQLQEQSQDIQEDLKGKDKYLQKDTYLEELNSIGNQIIFQDFLEIKSMKIIPKQIESVCNCLTLAIYNKYYQQISIFTNIKEDFKQFDPYSITEEQIKLIQKEIARQLQYNNQNYKIHVSKESFYSKSKPKMKNNQFKKSKYKKQEEYYNDEEEEEEQNEEQDNYQELQNLAYSSNLIMIRKWTEQLLKLHKQTDKQQPLKDKHHELITQIEGKQSRLVLLTQKLNENKELTNILNNQISNVKEQSENAIKSQKQIGIDLECLQIISKIQQYQQIQLDEQMTSYNQIHIQLFFEEIIYEYFGELDNAKIENYIKKWENQFSFQFSQESTFIVQNIKYHMLFNRFNTYLLLDQYFIIQTWIDSLRFRFEKVIFTNSDCEQIEQIYKDCKQLDEDTLIIIQMSELIENDLWNIYYLKDREFTIVFVTDTINLYESLKQKLQKDVQFIKLFPTKDEMKAYLSLPLDPQKYQEQYSINEKDLINKFSETLEKLNNANAFTEQTIQELKQLESLIYQKEQLKDMLRQQIYDKHTLSVLIYVYNELRIIQSQDKISRSADLIFSLKEMKQLIIENQNLPILQLIDLMFNKVQFKPVKQYQILKSLFNFQYHSDEISDIQIFMINQITNFNEEQYNIGIQINKIINLGLEINKQLQKQYLHIQIPNLSQIIKYLQNIQQVLQKYENKNQEFINQSKNLEDVCQTIDEIANESKVELPQLQEYEQQIETYTNQIYQIEQKLNECQIQFQVEQEKQDNIQLNLNQLKEQILQVNNTINQPFIQLKKQDLQLIKSYKQPPFQIHLICSALMIILNSSQSWNDIQMYFSKTSIEDITKQIQKAIKSIEKDQIIQAEELLNQHNCDLQQVKKATQAGVQLFNLVKQIFSYSKSIQEKQQIESEIKQLEDDEKLAISESFELKQTILELQDKQQNLQNDLAQIKNKYEKFVVFKNKQEWLDCLKKKFKNILQQNNENDNLKDLLIESFEVIINKQHFVGWKQIYFLFEGQETNVDLDKCSEQIYYLQIKEIEYFLLQICIPLELAKQDFTTQIDIIELFKDITQRQKIMEMQVQLYRDKIEEEIKEANKNQFKKAAVIFWNTMNLFQKHKLTLNEFATIIANNLIKNIDNLLLLSLRFIYNKYWMNRLSIAEISLYAFKIEQILNRDEINYYQISQITEIDQQDPRILTRIFDINY